MGIATGKTPLLQDLYEELLKQPEPEARRVATALELYCTGSLKDVYKRQGSRTGSKSC